MKKFVRLLGVLWFVSCGLLMDTAHSREKIVFGHNGFCPYHCVASQTQGFKRQPGFFVELIILALDDSRFQPEFRLVPLERAREDLKNGRLDAWASGAIAFYPEHLVLVPGVDVVSDYGCFYARADDPWNYRTPMSLASRSLATKEAYFSDEFPVPGEEWKSAKGLIRDKLLPRVIYVKGVDVQERLIQLLLRGRVDTIFEGNAGVDYLIAKEAYPVRKKGCLEFEFKENVIVSRRFTAAEELLTILNKKFRMFQTDGTMANLKAKYHLN